LAASTAAFPSKSAQAICFPTIPGCPGYEEPPPPRIEIYEQEIGQITIGAILSTYVSAPLSARGTLTWTMSQTRTETFRAITESGSEVPASRDIPTFSGSIGPVAFSIGGSVNRVQGRSTKVTNAITTASTESQSIQTAPVAGGGYNTWENTAFLMMARPVLSIRGLITEVNGRRTWDGRYYFKFVHGGTLFPRSARELRDDPATRNFIGPETADAILNEYPLKPGQTSAAQLGLGGPRFGPPTAIAPGTTPFTFSQSMTGTDSHSEERTRSVTTTIKIGFRLSFFGIQIVDFDFEKKFFTRHTDVQETSNSQVISTSGTLSSDLNHLNYIIEDRVWNTLLITDEGPLPGAFNAVSGTVTAEDGTPVGGAVVSMLAGGITHETFTDKQGNYTLRLGGDVQPGEYQLTCGGVTRTVTVSRGKTASADYRRVNARLARERSR
jgi:hypothetical protein